jgi:hypothetical protein
MSEQTNRNPEAGSPAAAFESLRAEVSLLRRGVEALTAERQNAPDYTPSFASIEKRLDTFSGWVKRLNEHPSIKLSPQLFANELMSASQSVRREDAKAIADAKNGLDQTTRRLEAALIGGRAAAEQSRVLFHNRIFSLIAGMLIWAIVPGVIARSLPVSWAVPERIAARMLGLDMDAAGERMIVAADPERRSGLIQSHVTERVVTTRSAAAQPNQR